MADGWLTWHPRPERKTEFGTSSQTSGARIQPPRPDVAEHQDPGHSEADFHRDLEKATRRRKPA